MFYCSGGKLKAPGVSSGDMSAASELNEKVLLLPVWKLEEGTAFKQNQGLNKLLF